MRRLRVAEWLGTEMGNGRGVGAGSSGVGGAEAVSWHDGVARENEGLFKANAVNEGEEEQEEEFKGKEVNEVEAERNRATRNSIGDEIRRCTIVCRSRTRRASNRRLFMLQHVDVK
jgi:hypothetical protein